MGTFVQKGDFFPSPFLSIDTDEAEDHSLFAAPVSPIQRSPAHSQELAIDAKFALEMTGSAKKALSGLSFRHFNSQLYIIDSTADDFSTTDNQDEDILHEEAERLLGKDLSDALNIDEEV